MKLAHLILAHAYTPQLKRLVGRLNNADADVYIHVDAKTDVAAFTGFKQSDNVFLIKNNVVVGWGNYSMVQATLNSFEEILSAGVLYSHINLLSGQDYPLKSPAEIQKFLFQNNGKTFMRSQLVPQEWLEGGPRTQIYNLGDYKFPGIHRVQAFINKILPQRKIPENLTIYGISQWFTITPECALYVINYLKNKKHKNILRFFKFTWAVDEIIFQTILLNSPLKDAVVNNHLRYLIFTKIDSRPKILTMDDAETLKASGKFYARKFDYKVDEAILDFLDKELTN